MFSTVAVGLIALVFIGQYAAFIDVVEFDQESHQRQPRQ